MTKPYLQQLSDLQKEKLENDARIQAIQLELDKASAEYHATGKGMSRERYFKLRAELASLKPKSQSLQMDLGNLRRSLRLGDQKTLGEHFITVAQNQLPTQEFKRLLAIAIELRDGQAGH